MGMRKRIAKGFLHVVAPRLAFAALLPRKAARGVALTLMKSRLDRRPRRRVAPPGILALGSAVVALPIGVLIGRRTKGHRERGRARLLKIGPAIRSERKAAPENSEAAFVHRTGSGQRLTRWRDARRSAQRSSRRPS